MKSKTRKGVFKMAVTRRKSRRTISSIKTERDALAARLEKLDEDLRQSEMALYADVGEAVCKKFEVDETEVKMFAKAITKLVENHMDEMKAYLSAEGYSVESESTGEDDGAFAEESDDEDEDEDDEADDAESNGEGDEADEDIQSADDAAVDAQDQVSGEISDEVDEAEPERSHGQHIGIDSQADLRDDSSVFEYRQDE